MLVALLGVPASAHAQAVAYDVAIEAPDPLARLLAGNLDLVKWRGNPRISAGELERLVRAVPEQATTLLESEGYYAAKVEAAVDGAGANPVVRLSIEPGPRTRVGAVQLRFSGAVTQAGAPGRSPDDLRAAWMLPAGRPFRHADWEAAKRALLHGLRSDRHPQAAITASRATVDPDRAEATLDVEIDSGPAFTFGELSVEGLQRLPPAVITSLNRIRPGSAFRIDRLVDLQTALQDTGYFASVEVSADTAGPGTAAPITVRVTENRFRKVELGLGYSTNTAQRGHITYQDLNLRDLGWRLKSSLTLDTTRQAALAAIEFPQKDTGYRDSVGASLVSQDVKGETVDTLGLNARRAWGGQRLEQSVTFEYLFEQRRAAGAESVHNRTLPVTWALTQRRVDNLLFPTDGHVVTVQAGGAPVHPLADQPFLRAYVKAAGYFPAGRDATLIVRGEAGAVRASGRENIPAQFLFRAGGDQSVRGYAYQSLGVADGDAVVGGRYLAVGSLEYQRWIAGNWGAAVFYDAGNAADSRGDLRSLARGYGAGLRWRSPLGPLNFDVAYGRRTGEIRLHFSVGVIF